MPLNACAQHMLLIWWAGTHVMLSAPDLGMRSPNRPERARQLPASRCAAGMGVPRNKLLGAQLCTFWSLCRHQEPNPECPGMRRAVTMGWPCCCIWSDVRTMAL